MDQQSGKKKQDIFTITPEDLIELSREETVPKPWYKNIFPRQDDTEAKKFKFLKKSDEQHHKLMMLWIKATKPLTNINQLIQPDRVCVLFLKNIYTGMYFEVGRTEIKWDSVLPCWSVPIVINKQHCMDGSKIEYKWEGDKVVKKIESPDNLKFAIFDANEPKFALGNEDLLGTVSWKLSSLIDSPAYEISLTPILGNDTCGQLSVIGEYANPDFMHAKIRFRVAANLKNKHDAFLVINRIVCGNKELRPIYRTETILNTSTPYWKDVDISLNQWCNGDLKAKITIQLWSHGSSFQLYPHKCLAECEIDTVELLNGSQVDYPLIHERSDKSFGDLTIMRFQTIPPLEELIKE